MFEDPVWCFLNMKYEIKEGNSRFESTDILVGLKANNCSLQSHFQVIETEQQREKNKTITTATIKASN